MLTKLADDTRKISYSLGDRIKFHKCLFFQHDGLTLINKEDNILYLIRGGKPDEWSLMESNCQNREEEYLVLIDPNHDVTPEISAYLLCAGGHRQTEKTGEQPVGAQF